jgi:hypothetical protein
MADQTVTNSQFAFIDIVAAKVGQRFYRTAQPIRLEPWIFHGWSFTAPAGSRQKIEYVDEEYGFNNWQFLTNLTLPTSPYLFFDTTVTNRSRRFYRTSAIP